MNLPSHNQARHGARILNIVDLWKQQLDTAVSDDNTLKKTEWSIGKKNEEGKFRIMRGGKPET